MVLYMSDFVRYINQLPDIVKRHLNNENDYRKH